MLDERLAPGGVSCAHDACRNPNNARRRAFPAAQGRGVSEKSIVRLVTLGLRRFGAQTMAKFSDVIRFVALRATTCRRNSNRNLKNSPIGGERARKLRDKGQARIVGNRLGAACTANGKTAGSLTADASRGAHDETNANGILSAHKKQRERPLWHREFLPGAAHHAVASRRNVSSVPALSWPMLTCRRSELYYSYPPTVTWARAPRAGVSKRESLRGLSGHIRETQQHVEVPLR